MASSSLSQVSTSTTSLPFLIPKHKHFFKLYPSSLSCTKTLARSEGTASGVTTEQDPPSFSGLSLFLPFLVFLEGSSALKEHSTVPKLSATKTSP